MKRNYESPPSPPLSLPYNNKKRGDPRRNLWVEAHGGHTLLEAVDHPPTNAPGREPLAVGALKGHLPPPADELQVLLHL